MKVLIGEDDKAIHEVVKIILEGDGYTVISALDEKTVLQLAKNERPSLIFLDISLGSADGGLITQRLKKDTETKDIPIIIMSANTETETIANASGADGFLLKPFDIADLLNTVKQFTV